ncbi:MAG: 3D domain-containing protein [Planctomycetota bacterium]|nr:3D domain-containing protein [Planctomycetota bacterium]
MKPKNCPVGPRAEAFGVSAGRRSARIALHVGVAISAIALTAFSAILAKEATHMPLLAGVYRQPLNPDDVAHPTNPLASASDAPEHGPADSSADSYGNIASDQAAEEFSSVRTASFSPGSSPDPAAAPAPSTVAPSTVDRRSLPSPEVRWFDGRPVRPARKMWMTVTAYSPDWRSCGDSDDGITATLHSVTTNGHALVAADTRILPYGSMLTIPGYDAGHIVPVLDCGGAIKGRRLDVLFPTHEQARAWGVRRVLVTVWEYADGKGRVNPRKLR